MVKRSLDRFTPLALFLLILFASAVVCGQSAGTKGTSPNIIIVLVDDLGYQDVGFNGCKDIITPNIDRIATEGVLFSDGYVTYPVCGPSRAGLITGRYQDRFGFGRNPLFAPKDPNMGLPLSEETLADVLRKADYSTVAIGKWHLGAHPALHPLKRGFDDFFGFLTGGHNYFPEEYTLADETKVTSQYAAYRTRLLRDHTRVEESEYLTDALSREAVSYIKKHKDRPFFMYLAYNAPHTPLQATEKYLSRYDHIQEKKRKTYAAMVSAVDDGVGAILKCLDDLGIDDNTMIVFLSDNGGPEKVNASDNGALRAGKGSVFEGGIRVPFAMRWPAMITGGRVFEQPVISLDIFATAIGNTQKTVPTKNEIDGVNLVPYLLNGQKIDRNLYWRQFGKKSLVVRSNNLKYLSFQKQDTKHLFDLSKDVSEDNDIKKQFKGRVSDLDALLQKWNKQLIDPVFMGLLLNDEYNKLHPDRWGKD